MNTGNIVEKFELLSGIESSESIKWRSVVDDACAYVYSRIADKPLSASDERRIELLCAVYAYKLYVMCGKSEVSSFKAGDVTVQLLPMRATKPKSSGRTSLQNVLI